MTIIFIHITMHFCTFPVTFEEQFRIISFISEHKVNVLAEEKIIGENMEVEVEKNGEDKSGEDKSGDDNMEMQIERKSGGIDGAGDIGELGGEATSGDNVKVPDSSKETDASSPESNHAAKRNAELDGDGAEGENKDKEEDKDENKDGKKGGKRKKGAKGKKKKKSNRMEIDDDALADASTASEDSSNLKQQKKLNPLFKESNAKLKKTLSPPKIKQKYPRKNFPQNLKN
jgi:hypothetical protein